MKEGRISLSWFTVGLVLLFASCNKSMDTFLTEDKQTSNNETTQESTISELDDLATTVLNSSNTSGVISGRTDVTLDDRLNCTGTTIEFSNVSADKTTGKSPLPSLQTDVLTKEATSEKVRSSLPGQVEGGFSPGQFKPLP